MSAFSRIAKKRASQLNHNAGRILGWNIARSPAPASLTCELRRLLLRLDISHVIDVGAHHGGFARRLRDDAKYTKAITSFEPSPSSFRRLREAASADPLWNPVNLALGARAGTAEFHEFGGDGQFDSLRSLGSHAATYSSGLSLQSTITVPVQRLDAVWTPQDVHLGSTLLKTDTQGFDLEVIEGAGELLRKIPAVLMEVAVMPLYEGAPTVPDVLAVMAGLGFELTGAFPIHRYAAGLRVIEFDCTFINPNLLRACTE